MLAITLRVTLNHCALRAVLLFLYGSSTLFRTNPQNGKEYHIGSSFCQYFKSKIEKGYYHLEHN